MPVYCGICSSCIISAFLHTQEATFHKQLKKTYYNTVHAHVCNTFPNLYYVFSGNPIPRIQYTEEEVKTWYVKHPCLLAFCGDKFSPSGETCIGIRQSCILHTLAKSTTNTTQSSFEYVDIGVCYGFLIILHLLSQCSCRLETMMNVLL